MTATRPQSRSASARLCVVRNTVTPSRDTSVPRSSRRAAAATGSSPAVGSSRNNRLGRCSRARATASFCFMPWLHRPTGSPAPIPEPQRREQFANARAARRRPHPPDAGVEIQVVLGAQPFVEPWMLEQGAGVFADEMALGPHVVAQNGRAALGRIEQAEQEPDGRGLAGAVRAEKPEHDARRHLEVQAVNRAHRLEGARQSRGSDDGSAIPSSYPDSRRRPGCATGGTRLQAGAVGSTVSGTPLAEASCLPLSSGSSPGSSRIWRARSLRCATASRFGGSRPSARRAAAASCSCRTTQPYWIRRSSSRGSTRRSNPGRWRTNPGQPDGLRLRRPSLWVAHPAEPRTQRGRSRRAHPGRAQRHRQGARGRREHPAVPRGAPEAAGARRTSAARAAPRHW